MRKLVVALSLALALAPLPVFAGEDAVESPRSLSFWVSQVIDSLSGLLAGIADDDTADTDKGSGDVARFGVEIVPSG